MPTFSGVISQIAYLASVRVGDKPASEPDQPDGQGDQSGFCAAAVSVMFR